MDQTAACHDGPHFLLLPFAEQGHLNPMLSLASQLAAHPQLHCTVTFVNIASIVGTAAEASCSPASFIDVVHEVEGSRLHFATLAPAAAAPGHKPFEHVSMSSRHMVFKQKLGALERQQALIEKMVADSRASASPISGIICDVLMWKWVSKLAKKHGLKLAFLVPCSALFIFVNLSPQIGKEAELDQELLVSKFHMPGKDDARRLGFFNINETPEAITQKRKFWPAMFEGLEHVGAPFLVNSFKRLEEPLLPLIEASGLDMKFIGPCVPTWGRGDNSNIALANTMAQRAGSALVQEEACLAWLSKQDKSSVLFVSFGSEGVLEAEHVEEIAVGIDNSGCRFLWVVRPDIPALSRPPEAFRQRNSQQGRGMFVSWAPQRAVLQHVAVGGFLTHSGWNSTLESLSYGVPMLCLPLISDQPLNANLVQCYWQVGLRLESIIHEAVACNRQSVVISRADVERGVRALLQGGRFSEKAAYFQHAAQLAIQDEANLLAFVESIN